MKGPGDLHLFEYNELCSPSSVVAKSPDADGDHNFTHSSRSSIQSPTDQDGAGGLSSSLNINRRDYSTRGTRIHLSQEWFCTSTSGGSSPMLTTKPLLTAFRVSLVLFFGAQVDLKGSVFFGRVPGQLHLQDYSLKGYTFVSLGRQFFSWRVRLFRWRVPLPPCLCIRLFFDGYRKTHTQDSRNRLHTSHAAGSRHCFLYWFELRLYPQWR